MGITLHTLLQSGELKTFALKHSKPLTLHELGVKAVLRHSQNVEWARSLMHPDHPGIRWERQT